ncbi:MAG: GNAT family N-acetyltransferase [Hyphomicrobiales bacterium]|jgi:ribosomal protein S18 acetylase RimI-like enzyme
MAVDTTDHPIIIEPGLRADHRKDAVLGYWEAFSRKLRYPLGPRHKALAFIERVLDPTHAISAISSDGEFLGVAGFKTPDGAFVGGGLSEMIKVYGSIGGTVRGLLIGLLERENEPDTLLMDGIFVQPAARSRGVGTLLLSAIEEHAVRCGLTRVRLDVIDTNPRAKALYTQRGFVETSQMSVWPFSGLFGFQNASTMTKAVV